MNTKLELIITTFILMSACNEDNLVMIPTESPDYRFEQSCTVEKLPQLKSIDLKTDEYQILSVADSHLGTSRNLSRFFNMALTENSAAVVLDGDITNGHSINYDELDKCLPKTGFPPLYFISGNHDIYFGGWDEFYKRYGSSTYFFEIITLSATDLFICLDSSSGTHGNKQLNWFENILKNNRQKYRHCIVFTHNNIFRENHTPSTNPFTSEIHRMIKIFTEYNVEMVITGHDHHRAESTFGRTRYIQLDATHDRADQASYLKLTVKGHDLSYCFVKI